MYYQQPSNYQLQPQNSFQLRPPAFFPQLHGQNWHLQATQQQNFNSQIQRRGSYPLSQQQFQNLQHHQLIPPQNFQQQNALQQQQHNQTATQHMIPVENMDISRNNSSSSFSNTEVPNYANKVIMLQAEMITMQQSHNDELGKIV